MGAFWLRVSLEAFHFIYHNPFLCQLLGMTFCYLRLPYNIHDRNGCRRQLNSPWHVTRLDEIVQFTFISSCEVCDNVYEVCWFNAGLWDLWSKSFVNMAVQRVYSREPPCGISVIRNKIPHITHVQASNDTQQMCPRMRITYNFFFWLSENIPDDKIDMILYIYNYLYIWVNSLKHTPAPPHQKKNKQTKKQNKSEYPRKHLLKLKNSPAPPHTQPNLFSPLEGMPKCMGLTLN